MSTTPEEHEAVPDRDESPESESSGSPGIEVGFVEAGGTSFEPEEDPPSGEG
jgi:hypothetical protein